ncbi:SurA N-terminal domain-containing protein [Pontimicrobium sp. IMCC45349]|uniref:SurA N-terminal domain-containing protein n=1 Tax=Pontimicrobium sp. IMCC45349 TaxID=3391574 RepID=UPI0039A330B9
MAILNKIRQRSLFLILVIAMALFSFVLADLFKSGSGFSGKSQNVIATINGVDIQRDDFMNKVENAQRQYGNSLSSTQAMNRVWDTEVRNAVMQGQFEALGLSVEKDQMRDLIKQSLSTFEEFKNEAGVFDEDKLNEFIANLKAISPETTMLNGSPINYEAWNNFEKNIAEGGVQQTYFNLVKGGIVGTLTEGELDYKLENDKVDLKFVQIPFTTIADSTISVSKSEISNYINNHKEKYQVEASRDIFFVQFKEEASQEDEEEIKKGLLALVDDKVEFNETTKANDNIVGFKNVTDHQTYVNANSAIKYYDAFVAKSALPSVAADSIYNLEKGSVYGPYKDGAYYKLTKMVDVKQIPDSAKVRHILIPFVGATRVAATETRTDAQAKATADSIYNVLKGNRSKFKSLLELSSDKVSNEKDGEIEFAYTDGYAPEFKAFSFENNTGDLEVVKTSFGYHVIEILSQGNKQKAVKVATLAHAIEASEKTIDDVFNKKSKFEIAVVGNDFEEIAKEQGLEVETVSNIKVLDESIPRLGSQRGIVRWAFESDKIGAVKSFNVPGGGYAVAVLTGINEEGLMTPEKASVTALPEIRKEKKAKQIMDAISATTVDDIAAAQGQTVKTSLAVNMKNPTLSGAGREPKVIGTAFGLKEGETSKLVVGNSGVFVVQVTKITPADELPNYQAAANRVGNAKSAVVNTALFNALKEASEIEDNRATFY